MKQRLMADSIVGAGAIVASYGVYLMYPPIAFIADGLALVVLGVTLDSGANGIVSHVRKIAGFLK